MWTVSNFPQTTQLNLQESELKPGPPALGVWIFFSIIVDIHLLHIVDIY